MKDPRNIAVIGVTGYTGFELAKLLLRHPEVRQSTFYVRDSNGAECLSQLFPQLRGSGEAPLRPLSLAGSLLGRDKAPLHQKFDYGIERAVANFDALALVALLEGGGHLVGMHRPLE